MSLIARPFKGTKPITQTFGPTLVTAEPALYGYQHFHTGVDYGMPVGTPLYASFDGALTIPASDPHGYGLYCLIGDGNGLVSYLCHLSKVVVAHGTRVRKGQFVALSGNSGNSSGPHLHWSLSFEGMYTHPWPWVAE